jgi:long-subunit acyl-CoA synthetase (AMP-forming)
MSCYNANEGVFLNMIRYSGFEDLLEQQTLENGSKPAFLYDDNGRKVMTWKEFHDAVLARRDALKADGKTSMGILADGSLGCVIEIFAANLAGMQVTMLDHTLPAAVLAPLIRYTDTDCLWANEVRKKELSPFLTEGVRGQEGNILFFTSGTTSMAKAVVLTDTTLMSSAYNGSCKLPLQPYDILLCALPLGHVFGFVCGLLWGMACGAVIALGRGPRHYIDDLAFYKPTAVSVVPLLLGFFEKYHLFNPELSLVLVGAGECAPELLKGVQDAGIRVSYGYGLTETSSGVAISVKGDPAAMEVCPDDTITLAEDGEILIDAPTCMMKGYYKKKEDTEKVLINGILHTGDLGHFDEEGKLHITGRKKDILVLTNGTKIFLPEYEMNIMKALNAGEIAVVLRNHKPVLVTSGLQETKEQIHAKLDALMKTLPHGSQLTDIIRLDHPLARTATGKLKRWEIQKEIEKWSPEKK